MKRLSKGNQALTDALRHLVETEGVGALATWCETRLNAIARSHGGAGLTDQELAVRRACRAQFGIYDPSKDSQRQFIQALDAEPEPVAA